jgi:predicted dienelactone hydrolase
MFDPFARGAFSVEECTMEARDTARNRSFPCEVWRPENAAGESPVIVFSHSSGGGRRQSTFLCTHLASHGYVVAAMDHSEVVAPELARKEGETPEQKAARTEGWLSSRVPDIRFLLDHLAQDGHDVSRVGIAGHSFGGWTALAAPDTEPRIGAVVAMAPAGSSRIKPGILPAKLSFQWDRDVPTLLLAAANDISLPLEGMYEIFARVPATKRLAILCRADHLHFMDDVEKRHEAVRAIPFSGELSWISKEMLPISELCSGERAHLFTCGLTLAHFDAVLRESAAAWQFLEGDVEAELARRAVEAQIP